jgi:vacuolar-type H+-ATPase subunit H
VSEAAGTSPGSPEVLEALRRVKSTEADWDRRLADARAASASELARHREESDAAVHAVAREVETERAEAVTGADREAEAEARAIVADGEAEARKIRSDEGSLAERRRTEILAVVLGRLASD